MKSQNESKWTAGRWVANIGGAGCSITTNSTIQYPIEVRINPKWLAEHPERVEEAQANARLIAQSPDMLSALELALCYMEADGDDEQEREDYAKFAAIIARAKGETK